MATVTSRAMLPIELLQPNPKNDKIHPESQLAMLVASIARFGQPQPVLVRQANHMLIAGHAVHEAMKRSGATEIDAIVWDIDQRSADAFLLAANRLAELSASDPERRRALLEEIDEIDFPAVGFEAEEVQKLLETEGLTIVEVATEPVEDEFWISCRGPLARQAEVLKRMQQLLAEFGDVEVDLGTIAT